MSRWQALRRRGRGLLRLAALLPFLVATWIVLAVATVRIFGGAVLRGRRRRQTPVAAGAGSRTTLPRVLLVTPYPLYPAVQGGSVRTTNLLAQLRDRCEVHVLVFDWRGDDPAQRAALEPLCASFHVYHWGPPLERWPLWLQTPNEQLFWSPRAAQRIRDLVETRDIEVVVLEHTELAQYRRFCGRARVVLVEIDVAFRSLWRRYRLGFVRRFPNLRHYGASFTDWMRLLRYETASCRAVDQVHFMSERDRDEIARLLPDGERRLRVVPNGVDTNALCPPAAADRPRDGILFLGNFRHLPNVDALSHFMRDVFPLLRLRCPDVRLTIVGNEPEGVAHYGALDGVEVVGSVPDVRPYLHGHRVMVAPIRAGSGTRLKLLEAFAAGLPAVSTTIGAEGLDVRDGEHILIADAPVPFARAVERLLVDDDLHARITGSAMALARERYDWSHSASRMADALLELVPVDARAPSAVPRDAARPAGCDVSIVIPTLRGGERLLQTLDAVRGQQTIRSVEVICVDSGSSAAECAAMESRGATVHRIPGEQFNHGLTRDLGARLSGGRVLVFINQDAVPASPHWLDEITEPLFAGDPGIAAVQGAIAEFPDPEPKFFWHSCGDRFYFTRETASWLARYDGLGFSTVNAALRRDVWERHPFGWAPIMEDKKWQREIVEAGYRIVVRPGATAHHTHVYGLRALVRRCIGEGEGWRRLEERYRLGDAWRDLRRRHVWRELVRGLRAGEVRTVAELVFPGLRPLALYYGNRWSRAARI